MSPRSCSWRPNTSTAKRLRPHFGWRFGSPPGVPGGGITGVRPPPTGGTAIPGSTPAGGHITPLDSESCSLSGRFPVVSLERGATLPRPGEQFRFDGDDEGGGSERFDCACAVVVASNAAAARATAMVELRIGNLRGVFVCNVNVRRRRSFRREPSPPVRARDICDQTAPRCWSISWSRSDRTELYHVHIRVTWLCRGMR